MSNQFNKITGKSQDQTHPQRNHFIRTNDGNIKLSHNGVEKHIINSVKKEAIEEMKQCMYEFEGKPLAWDTLSPEQRAADFDALTENYRRSKQCSELVQFVDERISIAKGLKIRTCILAGIGSFNTSPRARSQLAAFEVILELLRRTFDVEDVLVQDPAMDQLDEEFLQGRGYTVVKHPEAQNAIDETTFLFCPCINWAAMWEFLIVEWPPLYYGPKQEEFEAMLLDDGPGAGVLMEDTVGWKMNMEFSRSKAGRTSAELRLMEAEKGPENEFVWLDATSG